MQVQGGNFNVGMPRPVLRISRVEYIPSFKISMVGPTGIITFDKQLEWAFKTHEYTPNYTRV